VNRRWVAAGTALLVLLTLAWILGGTFGSGNRVRFPSSYAAEPEGLLGLRLLLEQAEIPTIIETRPWDETLSPDTAGVLVVATPLQRSPDRRETDGLRGWLEAGGALLVLDDANGIEGMETFFSLLSDLGLDAQRPPGKLDPRTLGFGRPETRLARGTAARPSDGSWREIGLNAGSWLSVETRAIPLAIDADGRTKAGEVLYGKGRAVRVMGTPLSNDRILSGDNLAFGLSLIDDLRGDGAVVFDEYHHGFGGLIGAGRLDRGVLGWVVVQALVVLLVFALARGARFGPVRPERRLQRRSSLEFVHSMASLYRRAHAHRHVVDGAWRRYLREARARWGLVEKLPTRQLAQSIAQLGGLPPEAVARTLAATRDALDGREEITEATMLARVRELARLEKESFR